MINGKIMTIKLELQIAQNQHSLGLIIVFAQDVSVKCHSYFGHLNIMIWQYILVCFKKNISGGERTVIVLYSSWLACLYAVTWLITAPYTTKLTICHSISAFWDTSYFKMLYFEALLALHIFWGFVAFGWIFSAIFYLLIRMNNEPLVKSLI